MVGGLLWLQPNMPLSAFPLNLQPRGEMFLISVGNYLKSLTQQKRDFNSVSSSPLSPHEMDFMSYVGVILVGMFFTTAVTDSLPGSSYKACLRNLPQREIGRNTVCVDCSLQEGAGLIQTALDLLCRALPGLSCPSSKFSKCRLSVRPLVCLLLSSL